MIGISLVVVVIFEGFFVVVIIILVIGVQCMVKKNVFVRKFLFVEILGCVNVICLDKIGILIENKMIVKRIEIVDMSIEVEGIGYDLKGRIFLNG